jgi:multidrug transporter EmrE-like cation transporter
VLTIPVVILGLAVLWRTEKIRVVLVFLLVAVATSLVRQAVQATQFDIAFDVWTALQFAVLQSPFLFLGAFMLSEPLTLPPRRRQQIAVAVVVGLLAGWPISVAGLFTLGQERALLIGNLVAFAFALRGSVRLVLERRRFVTPTAQELTFRAKGRVRFLPGQYLELDVPHHRPDARGTRREFSIVSAPADLPTLRIAYKNGDQKHPSSYKRALAAAEPGATFAVTGTWGDFILPRGEQPVLMVAAGIGVTWCSCTWPPTRRSSPSETSSPQQVCARWCSRVTNRSTCPRTGPGVRARASMPRPSNGPCPTSSTAMRSSQARRA